MKHFTYFLAFVTLFLVAANSAIAQEYYRDIYLEPDKLKVGKYKGFDRFEPGGITVLKKGKKIKNLLVLNEGMDDLLLNFQPQEVGDFFDKPKFFKTTNPDHPTIMIVDEAVKFSHSHGINIFLIKDKKIHRSGFLPFAADNYNFSSLALYSNFEITDGRIFMNVQDVEIIDLKNEEVVEGSTLRWEITEKSVKRVIDY